MVLLTALLRTLRKEFHKIVQLHSYSHRSCGQKTNSQELYELFAAATSQEILSATETDKEESQNQSGQNSVAAPTCPPK